jgi:hypothetical protein
MVKAGLRGESVDLTEQKVRHEAKSREELIAVLADKLTSGPIPPMLARHLAERNREVIEGHVVETRAVGHPHSTGV